MFYTAIWVPKRIIVWMTLQQPIVLVYFMKREGNLPNNIFLSSPSTHVTFNGSNLRPYQRESEPVDHSRQPDHPPRYSIDTGTSNSSNAFVHLRSEISNLRSEFTRLIQKDVQGEKAREDRTKLLPQHKQERSAAHSTIGFYNMPQGKAQLKGEFFFKGKTMPNDQRSSVENGQIDKKGKIAENGISNSKYQKKYSFQVLERREQALVSHTIESSKIKELQLQIRKLGDIKNKLEEENVYLKKEFSRIDKEMQMRVTNLSKQNESLRASLEQAQISISLKQSLLQKLENDFNNSRDLVQQYSMQNKQLKYELQNQNYQHLVSKSFEGSMKQLQNRHKIDQQALKEKEEQCAFLRNERNSYQNKFKQQIATIELFQGKINELQAQYHLINQQYETIQSKNQLLQQNQKPNQSIAKALQEKCKTLQDENTDLKKRVEFYKKTVEQLNAANNSTRQKLVGLKEEARKGREDAKSFAEQLQVKEKLISSLYRDINILDAEIRHSSHLKTALSNHVRYIEELTQRIIDLQCRQLNHRYSLNGQQEQIQYS